MKKREKAIVILCRNRVNFMVVASRTTDCHTEHHLPCCRNNIIKIVVPREFPIGRSIVPNTESMIPSRNDSLYCYGLEFITCQLLLDEFIIRFVFVERVNDVIAVSPHVRLICIALITVCFCVPDKVKPMPSPLLTISWRLQNFINEFLISVGCCVIQERVHCFRRRR